MKELKRLNPSAAKIGKEFGRLFHDGRGRVVDICGNEAGQVQLFLDAARAPIIKGLLPGLSESTEGGYIVGTIGPNGSEWLRFSDDFSRWHVRNKERPGCHSDVASLVSYLGCGRSVTTHDLTLLLGVATARALQSK